MVTGMATAKVTITLDVDQLARVRERVGAGAAPTVSAFVQRAVSAALDETAAWAASLAESLAESGGPLTDQERAWADQVLTSSPPSPACAGNAA